MLGELTESRQCSTMVGSMKELGGETHLGSSWMNPHLRVGAPSCSLIGS